jgi:hypothetical protein
MVKHLRKTTPRVLKDETAPPPGDATPTNQPDAETFHFHIGAIMRKQATIMAHRKEMKTIRRAAMDAGLNLADLDTVIKMREEEAETIQAGLKRLVQYAEWMGLAPKGTQGDLFKDAGPKIDAETMAEGEGYREGVEGNRGPAVEPDRYDVATSVGQARLRGWNAGQKVLHERFLSKQQQPETGTVQ